MYFKNRIVFYKKQTKRQSKKKSNINFLDWAFKVEKTV